MPRAARRLSSYPPTPSRWTARSESRGGSVGDGPRRERLRGERAPLVLLCEGSACAGKRRPPGPGKEDPRTALMLWFVQPGNVRCGRGLLGRFRLSPGGDSKATTKKTKPKQQQKETTSLPSINNVPKMADITASLNPCCLLLSFQPSSTWTKSSRCERFGFLLLPPFFFFPRR